MEHAVGLLRGSWNIWNALLFTVHFLGFFSATSRGMETKLEDFNTGPEIAENPTKIIHNPLLSKLLMAIDKKDNIIDPIWNGSDEAPVLEEDYIADESTHERDDDFHLTALTDDVINNSKSSTLGFIDSSLPYSLDDPVIIHIRPKPKVVSMHVPEFHECVSCNADDGARKYYGECLKELTFKNLEILSSCCHFSFDTEFCKRASTGKIDYKAICQDPSKAIKVGDCFWTKIENKDAEDIQKYRNCKGDLVDRYCTVQFSSEDDMKHEEI